MSRFLIVGLPRSGTTYLMSLLNSHAEVMCAGEQFNPHAIIDTSGPQRERADLLARDADPVGFLNDFYASRAGQAKAVGCKWMIGHHLEILNHIPTDPELRLIYVWRENKLAQTASLLKALKTRQWATRHADRVDDSPIDAGPFQVMQRAREAQIQDATFQSWLAQVPNPVLTCEYRAMFEPGFEEKLCDYLGVTFDPEMRSPLVKQGSSDILARFEKKKAVAAYFTQIGRADWLEPEL